MREAKVQTGVYILEKYTFTRVYILEEYTFLEEYTEISTFLEVGWAMCIKSLKNVQLG